MNVVRYKTTAARALIRVGDRILVEWYAPKGICFLPGGQVEGSEDPKEALARELGEEIAGLTLTIGRFLGTIGHSWMSGDEVDSCLNHFFEVSAIENGEVKAREKDREVRWLALTSPDLMCLKPPSLRSVLRQRGSWGDVEWEIIDREV